MIANYNNDADNSQHESVNPSHLPINTEISNHYDGPPLHLFADYAADDCYYADLAATLANREENLLPLIDSVGDTKASSSVPSDQYEIVESSENKVINKPSIKNADNDLSSCAVDTIPSGTIQNNSDVVASGSESTDNVATDRTVSSAPIYPPKFVVQQNRLLEAFKELSLYERRLFLYLSTTVRAEVRKNPDQNTFLVDIMDFARRFNIERGHHLYSFMRQAGKDMQKKSFEYTIEEDGYVDDVDVNFAFRFRYRPKDSKMWVSLTSEVIEMLTIFDAEHPFTRYELDDVVHMKNQNTIVLFELLIRYKKVGKRTLSIEYMRKVFGCEEKYSLITDFIRYVIKKSAKEITEVTDYKVEHKVIKAGGKPIEVEFTFKSTKQEMYKKGKDLALIDFGYTTPEEISAHNANKAVKLNISQLRRIVSRDAFINDHNDLVSPGSPENNDPIAFSNYMVDKLVKDGSFVKKHTLDYYIEQENDPKGS